VFGLATDYFYSRHFVNPTYRRLDAWGIEFGTQSPVSSWPEMQLIMADVGAGLFQFCLDAVPSYVNPGALVYGLPEWAELLNLVAEVVRVTAGVAAGGSGVSTPLGGVPRPVPAPSPYLRDLIEQLGVLLQVLSSSQAAR
jgi:hypothetical protein